MTDLDKLKKLLDDFKLEYEIAELQSMKMTVVMVKGGLPGHYTSYEFSLDGEIMRVGAYS